MDLEDYRALFAIVSLVLILVAAFPALSAVISLPSGEERFSELWLLGPEHKAENYPFNVRANQQYSIYVGVGNHLGYSAYYSVSVKFRNQTQPLPNSKTSEPSPLNSAYEFSFFLSDGKVWESPLTFAIDYVLPRQKFSRVKNISINGMVFPVNCNSIWDSDRNGFYYQVFFELWLYNMTSRGFQYHDRFVGIWLNVTIS